jgi:hypothetical protein
MGYDLRAMLLALLLFDFFGFRLGIPDCTTTLSDGKRLGRLACLAHTMTSSGIFPLNSGIMSLISRTSENAKF